MLVAFLVDTQRVENELVDGNGINFCKNVALRGAILPCETASEDSE